MFANRIPLHGPRLNFLARHPGPVANRPGASIRLAIRRKLLISAERGSVLTFVCSCWSSLTKGRHLIGRQTYFWTTQCPDRPTTKEVEVRSTLFARTSYEPLDRTVRRTSEWAPAILLRATWHEEVYEMVETGQIATVRWLPWPPWLRYSISDRQPAPPLPPTPPEAEERGIPASPPPASWRR